MASLLPRRYSQTFSIGLSSGSIGWQAHQSDVFGDRKRGSKMVAGAIEDESGVTACRHLAADRSEMQRAAETCGMDRQTLRDWVHRYNAAGLAGLRNLKSPGPGSKLQQAELAELVEAGPDPAVHGVVR